MRLSMSSAARQPATGAAFAALLVSACAAIAATVPSMGDYANELLPAMQRLLAGDISGFAQSAPVYGASAWPRLPFASLVQALGGGDLAVYRAGAFAVLLALAALVWWIDAGLRRSGRPALERLAFAAALIAAPVVLRSLRDGHPEEILAGTLAVSAVLLAVHGRPALAGCALGLAVAAKPWAVLAAAPVLLAAPDRRLLLTFAAGAVTALAVAPLLLLAGDRAGGHAHVLTQSNWIFHPQQLWWPLGERHANGGVTAPDGLVGMVRPIIVGLGLALSAAWALQRRHSHAAMAHDALLLLALVLLLRSAIDPWNNAYYAVPAVFALGAWESLSRRGLPVFSIMVLALTWLSFVRLPMLIGPDALAAVYAGWMVPLLAALALRLYAPALTSSPIAARTSPGST